MIAGASVGKSVVYSSTRSTQFSLMVTSLNILMLWGSAPMSW